MKPIPEKIRGFSGKIWPQFQDEIQGFIDFLKEMGVKSYLEIGCKHGDTFRAVGVALPKGSLLVAVDLPGARSGNSTGGKFPNSDKALHCAVADLKKRGQEAVAIIGDSHSSETIESVNKYSPFDAVFIDGDHSVDGVRADWLNYGPMGTLVAFHDIRAEDKGAASLWSELKQQYKHAEFAFYDRGGIGVLWKDND